MTVSVFPRAKSVHHLIEEYGIEYVYSAIQELPAYEVEALSYNWDFWARDSQVMPAWAWRVWFLKSGRGAGKTRVGAEVTRKKSRTEERIHLVGRTAADVRDVMVDGESGILAVSPPWEMPKYNPSKRLLTWPNGARALCFSAEEPDMLRGPQCGFGWGDELASWRYLDEAWSNFMFGLRLGVNPQALVTSTPRPVKIVKQLVANDGKTVHVTTESTFANRKNLAESWFAEILAGFEGTRLAQQELEGKVLDDNPNALWSTELIDDTRVSKLPPLDLVVVAVDPSVADQPTDETAECGIVVAGRLGRKTDTKAHFYAIDDCSIKGNPIVWGNEVVSAFHRFGANYVVAESNNGGALVKALIQSIDPDIKVVLVHAARGKHTRAEPISSLYEQKRAHHLGNLPELETQLVEWVPGDTSPDRLDALVWAATELMIGEKTRRATSL